MSDASAAAAPVFSIVVPVYNTAQYLEKCIGSLLGQSNGDLEVLAVDDGSTDGSGQMLEAIARRDPRLRVFAKPNGGQGSARNLGLAEARGRYVAFVDSDDTVHPDLLARAADLLADPTLDIVSFRLAFHDEAGRTVAARGPTHAFRSEGDAIFRDAMLDRNFLSSACNKVYRRGLLTDNAIRFPELRAYEDSVFSRLVARHARSVAYLDQDLYFALTRSGSTSRGMTEASFTRAAEMLALERRLFAEAFTDPELETVFRAHSAHFLAYLLVLAAFRIDDAGTRAACLRIADAAGFSNHAHDRRAMALLGRKAKAQVFLARHPRLLRAAALAARRLGRVPY